MVVPHSNVIFVRMTDKERTEIEILRAIRAARFANGYACPRCADARVIKWGRTKAHRQRYMCKSCNHTFCDLTGTPAFKSKRLDVWPAYVQCMFESLTLRPIAAQLDIHLETSFRLRHVIAGSLRQREQEILHGWIELEQLWFAYSRKGERGVKEPRRRGVRDRALTDKRPVRLLLANDRIGNATAEVFMAPLKTDEIETRLMTRFADCAGLFVGFGLLPVLRAVARHKEIPIVDGRGRLTTPASELARSTLAAKMQARLFMNWLERFNGVATKYLPNYVAWHFALDRERRQGFRAIALRWPLAFAA